MRYVAIGFNDDGSEHGTWTVRMFMDDGRVYDEPFTVPIPTFEQLLDSVVSARMQQLVASPPSDAELADPAVPIGEVEGPGPAPDTAVEVT